MSSLAGPRTASGSVYSGTRLSADATSPNCTSRSTSTVDCGAAAVSPMARLVETVVLPTPPLGEAMVMTRPV